MRTALVLAALTVAAALPAQTSLIISPGAFATKSGSGNTFPFGTGYTNWRYQQIHTDLPASVAVIPAMAWRRASGTSTLAAVASYVQIDLSTAATTAAAPSKAFASNHGPDLVTVVFGPGGPSTYLKVDWPALAPPTVEPAPFQYSMPFMTPFVYKSAPICWEIRVMDRPITGGGSFDCAGDPSLARIKWGFDMTRLKATTFGTGCKASGHTNASYASVNGTRTAKKWVVELSLSYGKANSTALWILVVDTTNWKGINLPFTLPGSTVNLLVAPLADLGPAPATDTTGFVYLPIVFPDQPVLVGVGLLLPWLFLDAGLPLGVGLSRATMFLFPSPSVWPPATAEYAWPGSGLVTEFTVR